MMETVSHSVQQNYEKQLDILLHEQENQYELLAESGILRQAISLSPKFDPDRLYHISLAHTVARTPHRRLADQLNIRFAHIWSDGRSIHTASWYVPLGISTPHTTEIHANFTAYAQKVLQAGESLLRLATLQEAGELPDLDTSKNFIRHPHRLVRPDLYNTSAWY